MANNHHPVPGWNWTAEYQTAGIPVVSSSYGITSESIQRVDFDFITRDITIDNRGSDSLRVGFTRNGVNGVGGDNYFLVRANTTQKFDVRVKSIFFRANSTTTDYSFLAGLTTIPAKQMPVLTGSAASGSLKWNGVG